MLKRTLKFRDLDKSFITLEVEIKEENKERKTVDLETVDNYKVLSISGDLKELTNGRGRARWSSGGQIQDDIRTKNKNKLRLLEIWHKWHLNDMKSGTKKQEECLRNWKDRPEGFSYEEDCKYLKEHKLYEDRGYAYGSAWLVEVLPEEIIKEVEYLCDVIS